MSPARASQPGDVGALSFNRKKKKSSPALRFSCRHCLRGGLHSPRAEKHCSEEPALPLPLGQSHCRGHFTGAGCCSLKCPGKTQEGGSRGSHPPSSALAPSRLPRHRPGAAASSRAASGRDPAPPARARRCAASLRPKRPGPRTPRRRVTMRERHSRHAPPPARLSTAASAARPGLPPRAPLAQRCSARRHGDGEILSGLQGSVRGAERRSRQLNPAQLTHFVTRGKS